MAKKIMIQGTMSNVGKSVIAAGLCRIFSRDGYNTAPFKSQNMALNSFVTKDGAEMGRAQVMQAEAAGKEPDVNMNPILLKPSTDTASQVIVMGEAVGCMTAAGYFKVKKDFIPDIKRAFDKLDRENDVIVIEGAGSPAEININKDDIVNFGMARMADSPVLLVGDIDRGGVFAQLAGTMMLLKDWEKAFVRGIIINKFRGDKTILDPGLSMLEELTGVPVLGVVPYRELALDQEDSLSHNPVGRKRTDAADIAVIRLPRLSNHTDMNPLQISEYVNLRFVSDPGELGVPDMVIIPGTKNTVDDLKWLNDRGLSREIKKYADKGGIVFGICGGFQILGETIRDNEVRDGKKDVAGLSLLPISTAFSEQKIRKQVRGFISGLEGDLQQLNGAGFEGYEIHMGISSEGEDKGYILSKGNVYGTYVHGIFDSKEITERLLKALLIKKGIEPDIKEGDIKDIREIREREYDALADLLRENLDMEKIYGILEGR